jgi:hypothetical protein
MNDRYVHPDHIDRRMPWDDLEPIDDEHDALRDAAIRYVALINAFSTAIERAISAPDASLQSARIAYWGIATALGLNSVAGRSMTDLAQACGCERASLSKKAREFVSANHLQPSFIMKTEISVESFSKARVQSIKRNGALPEVPTAGRSV